VIIFRTDGKKFDTTQFEKFSKFAPDVWNRFKNTENVKELERLSLYIPDEYQKEFSYAFKEYTSKIEQYGTEEDEIRETRKAA